MSTKKTAKKEVEKTNTEALTKEVDKQIEETTVKGTIKKPLMIKRISPSDCIGKPTKNELRSKKFSYEISGSVNGCEMLTNDYGDSVRFKGAFLANTMTRGYVTSAQAFLPQIAEGLLKNAVIRALEEDPNSTVKFAFRVFTELNENSPVGYSWSCQPIGEFKSSTDELAQLLLVDE